MRPLRQAVEPARPALCHPAARAQQVPAQLQQAGAHRLQAHLDRVARRTVPRARQREWAHAPEVDLLRAEDMVGELAREAVAVGRGVDLRHHGVDAAPRFVADGRRGEGERLAPLAGHEGRSLRHHPGEGRLGAGEHLAHDQLAEQVRRLDRHGIARAAAALVRLDMQLGAQHLHRSAREIAGVLEPLLADPVDRLLLPLDVERPHPGGAEIMHRAVGLRDLGDLVLGQLGGFVEARSVGQQRPHRLRRMLELPLPGLRRRGHVPASDRYQPRCAIAKSGVVAQPAAQGLQPGKVQLVVYEQLLMMDAAHGEQSGGADPLAARHIRAQRVADAQQLRWLEVAVREDAPIDRRIGFAEPDHRTAQHLIALRDRAGADLLDAAAMHHQIGIGADQRHAARRRRRQQRIERGEVFLAGLRAGHQHEIRLRRIVDQLHIDPVQRRAIARRHDRIELAPAALQRGDLVLRQLLPGLFARGVDVVVEIRRDAHLRACAPPPRARGAARWRG